MKTSYKITKDFINAKTDDLIFDYKLPDKSITKLRMIKYIIGDKSYYLLTTLVDINEYPLIDLQNIYIKRWGVETDFRYDKLYLMLDRLVSQSKQFIEQDVYTHQFILTMEAIIRLLFFDNEKGKFKMNTKNSIDVILDHLLNTILFKRKTKKTKFEMHRLIAIMTKSKTLIINGRKSERKRKRPYLKLNITFPKKRVKKKPRKKLPKNTKTNSVTINDIPINDVNINDKIIAETTSKNYG